MKIQAGIWCPWAEVLCCACHSGAKASAKRSIVALAPVEVAVVGSDYEICKCDRCDASIGVCSQVARCANLRDLLIAALGEIAADVTLEQTGGMCCATSIRLGPDRLLYASALEGPIVLCSYPRSAGDETDWDWEDPTLVAESDVVGDVVAAALAQLREWWHGAR